VAPIFRGVKRFVERPELDHLAGSCTNLHVRARRLARAVGNRTPAAASGRPAWSASCARPLTLCCCDGRHNAVRAALQVGCSRASGAVTTSDTTRQPLAAPGKLPSAGYSRWTR